MQARTQTQIKASKQTCKHIQAQNTDTICLGRGLGLFLRLDLGLGLGLGLGLDLGLGLVPGVAVGFQKTAGRPDVQLPALYVAIIP